MVRLLATVVAILIPGLAYAQGAISGRVADANGGALPGVVVSASGPLAQPRTTVTDVSGRYTFADVPDGAYVLAFSLPGFLSESRRDVVVSGGAAIVNATLRIGPLAETLSVAPPLAQRPQARCLHGADETPAEAARRMEALAAMRMIYQVLEAITRRPVVPPPSWQSLTDAPEVVALRRRADAVGDLARKLQWGEDEPLPGWGIAYVARIAQIHFALIDLRDPCGFSYSSSDPDVIPRGARVVPLDSTARK